MKPTLRALTLAPLFGSLVAVASCSGGGSSACTTRIAPGDMAQERVQTALIEATSGSTICFDEGTYTFRSELSLNVPGITIRSTDPMRPATLDWSAQTMGGAGNNSLNVTAQDFTLEDIKVKNTRGNGVRVSNTSNVIFRRVHTFWDAGSVVTNGAYSIYPVNVTGVLVEDCEVEGAADAGIYVGQSRKVVVRRNKVHGNVAGIEIENCDDAEVYSNEAYDNTSGILVFDLPNLPFMTNGARTLVRNNIIRENNRANFADPATIVAKVPAGTGVLLLASHQVEIRENTVTGNITAGVLAVSFSTLSMEMTQAGYNQYNQGTFVTNNMFAMNGSNPRMDLLRMAFGTLEDIVWDGTVAEMDPMAERNRFCVNGNGSATFRNLDYAHTLSGTHTDIAMNTCTHPSLPAVVLPFAAGN